jgi:shikimate kinase
MGAGKTTVGRRLAARLGWPWHDSDAEIEAATGLTVRQLHDRDGVEAMHALEAAQLLRELGESGSSVVSAAASIIEDEACRLALAAPDVAVVWLRATPAGSTPTIIGRPSARRLERSWRGRRSSASRSWRRSIRSSSTWTTSIPTRPLRERSRPSASIRA